jgi:hypothetical protein
MECDFCSDKNVVRRFECLDFDAESADAGVMYNGTLETTGPTNLVLHSINFWAACEACSRLVDDEDLDGLVGHSVMVFLLKGYRLSVDATRHIRHTYGLFFKHRIRVICGEAGAQR